MNILRPPASCTRTPGYPAPPGSGHFDPLPAHTESGKAFIESIHPGAGRALLYIVVAFVLTGLLWAGFGKVDVVATTPFRLVPQNQVKAVQTPRAGEIEWIGIREGDSVSGGSTLFRIRSRETWGDLGELEQVRVALRKAEFDLNRALPLKRRVAEDYIASLQDRLALMRDAERAHGEEVRSWIEADGAGSEDEAADMLSRLEASPSPELRFQSAELEYMKRRFAEEQRLYQKRLISRVTLDEARVRYLGALAALPSRMTEIHRLTTTVQEIRRQIAEARLELERETVRIASAYDEARLRYDRTSEVLSRDIKHQADLILAPEAGIVTQMLVNVTGQVVNRGQVLATLAPRSEPIVAEAMVAGRDVGSIRIGQVVRLKYEAFPFEEYGIQRGRLVWIAPDASADPVLGPVYRATVRVDQTAMWTKGEFRTMRFGMKGIAEVVTDRKSILDLLLNPLKRFGGSAGFGSVQGG